MGTHKAKKIWFKLAFSAALIVILLFILFPVSISSIKNRGLMPYCS